MIRAAFLLFCLIGACAPRETAADTCDLVVTRELAFTDTAALDSVIARSLGPTCDKAVGVYIVTSADGHPIWSWTAPLSHAFGDAFLTPDAAYVQSFLDRWAGANVSSTAAAPAWSAAIARFAGEHHSTLDRTTYEDIRARDLPMLCHLTGVARETCIFWEPGAARAGLFYERDVAVEEEASPT